MSYYQQEEQPVRNQRVSMSDSFKGCGSELLDCAKNGCIFKSSRGFWQANSCQMALSLMMAATVENAAIIMHAPLGCGAQLTQLLNSTTSGKTKRGLSTSPFVWLTTNMQKVDIINGGEKNLRETIRYTDKEFRPEIIFVVATCAPSIIGDDVESVIESEKENISAELTAIYCPGFKAKNVASAYDAFYHSLLRHIKFEPEPYVDYNPDTLNDPYDQSARLNYEYQKSNTVNLFNATSIGADDEAEITRLLNALNINVRIYAEYSNRDKFRMVSEAALNVSMCNVHDDYILKYLEEKYGIPYIIQGMPLGRKATREWLKKIAAFFGKEKEADKLCDYEEARLDKELADILPKIRDKRVMIGGGVVRVAQEARLLSSLGMKVLAIRPHHYENIAEPVYVSLNEEVPMVPVAVSNQLYELINQVKRYKPDIVVEHPGKPGWIARTGIPSVCLYSPGRSFFGYFGEFTFARRIALQLENTNYEKRISKYVKLPYKKEWYDKDPYSYVKV